MAVDWAYPGIGALGVELVCLVCGTLGLFETPMEDAKALESLDFDGYVATTSIAIGVTSTILLTTGFLATEKGSRAFEEMVGHPLAKILSQLAVVQPFLLDLGDEALQ